MTTPIRPTPVVLRRPGGLTVTVIPAHGARIAQITDPSGRRWLAETGAEELSAGAPVVFANGTRGGWDECFPSISPCPDPNRAGADIADHGDFWAVPWTVDAQDDDTVSLSGEVPGHPLRARKTLRLADDRPALRVELELHNRSERPYRYLYSAHPLWAFDNDVRLDVPGAGDLLTAFGPGWTGPVRGRWPVITAPTGETQDFSRVPRAGARVNFKVFVRWTGRVRLLVPARRTALVLRQSSVTAPWLGICVNRGAYPTATAAEHWIALEPTTSATDSLAGAGDQAPVLAPGETARMVTDLDICSEGQVNA